MINKDYQRVEHILYAISRINIELANCSKDEFLASETKKESVAYNFFIIGEAANKISNSFQEKHSEIPWSSMIGMRNKIVHDYIGTDYIILWNTAKSDLPLIEKLFKEIIVYKN